MERDAMPDDCCQNELRDISHFQEAVLRFRSEYYKHSPELMHALSTKGQAPATLRSEEHTSELQSLMRISYAVFCLKKKTTHDPKSTTKDHIKTQIEQEQTVN